MKKLIITSIAIVFFAGPAISQNSLKIDSKIKREKIEVARANGKLSARESRKLHREVNKLNRHRKIAESDGRITRKERRRLQLHSTQVNQKIRKEKRDLNRH